jgi:hypothetical protein
MPQETNLNVSPYFDDFDPNKNFYKVLFKPGYPIQSRELTNLQSILQNQIEKFGNHVFKDGSVVIPGQTSYNNNFYCVQIENTFSGIPLSTFLPSLKGKTIRGFNSGLRAKVIETLDSLNSPSGYITLFLNYLNTNIETGETIFSDSESLIVEETIFSQNSNTFVEAQTQFANTISSGASRIGSAIILSAGVYYVRGYFVDVDDQTLILDAHSNTPSYKVGFNVIEDIITSDEDSSLTDNSKGFNNYAAPGADRFRIRLELTKKDLNETNFENFIEIFKIENGRLIKSVTNPQYNVIKDELARRTYDQSGDFYVTPFKISALESLNNLKGNNGVFLEGQRTYNNNSPSDDIGSYKLSPGKAYIRGYEIETISPTYLDFNKTRTTKTVENETLNYVTGASYSLNRVYGSPIIGIATDYTVSLRDSRVGASQIASTGKEIGLARVYDFALESGGYDSTNPSTNIWNISLFDIQTYTEISFNVPTTLSVPTFIKGKSSGATGYLRYSTTNSGIATFYGVQGKFSKNEKFIFNGTEDLSRISIAVTSYGTSDIKSLYGIVGSAYTFTADVMQSSAVPVGIVSITSQSGGVSTVTSSTFRFAGIATVGNVVSYSTPGLTTPSFARISSVSDNSVGITSVTSVAGVCSGFLPTSPLTPGDFTILSSSLLSSIDDSLYTVLPKRNISSVDLTDSRITIRRQYDVTIANNQTSTVSCQLNEKFLSFDEERYVLIREDGVTEPLSSDKVKIDRTANPETLTIVGLNATSSTRAKLITTIERSKVKNKIKNKSRVKSIVVDKSKLSQSGIGTTNANDGLTYGLFPYGTRVQDEEICLLTSDVTKIYGIFESNDTTNPDVPSIILESIQSNTSTTSDLIVGEEFVGLESNTVGLILGTVNYSTINFVSLNENKFVVGETIRFKESGVKAIVSQTTNGDFDITSNYLLDRGQKNTHYDYSKIIRKSGINSPSRKIKIFFESASFSSADNGDFITKNSYDSFDYKEIPSTNGIKNSDILDIRPSVSDFAVTAESRSPFEFLGRSFTGSGNYVPNILASDEDITIDYSFYLPRIDRIFVSKNGIFQISQGSASETPELPKAVDDALEIATAYLPAYIYNINDIKFNILQHKRYTMKDISKLETRIENLEYYTTLSLLETKTSNLAIKDSQGFDRFKSGFFVDTFDSTSGQRKVTNVKNSIDVKNSELRPTHYTNSLDLGFGDFDPSSLNDSNYQVNIQGSNITKSERIVTLGYSEVLLVPQPFATRVENVTPYLVTYYTGTIELNPTSDTWVDTVRLNANTIVSESYIETQTQLSRQEFDSQSGFGQIVWGSWNTIWTGNQTSVSQGNRIVRNSNIIQQTNITNTSVQISNRTGTSTRLTRELGGNTSLGDKTVSSEIIPFMRSRNIEFIGKRFKPYSRLYAFFDGVDVNNYCFPKLLEIQMVSNTFSVGETVIGSISNGNANSPTISFRVSKLNHKEGPYNNPSDIYIINPYNSNTTLPENYSSTSSILNVDTFSLSLQSSGNFHGWITSGMTLRGQTSGAVATVTNVRLVTDGVGSIKGSFFIPNPNANIHPKFEVGTKVFRLTNSSTNSLVGGLTDTSSEEKYFAEGKTNTVQENILSVRTVRKETAIIEESRTQLGTSNTVVVENIVGTVPPPPPPPVETLQPQPPVVTQPPSPPPTITTVVTPTTPVTPATATTTSCQCTFSKIKSSFAGFGVVNDADLLINFGGKFNVLRPLSNPYNLSWIYAFYDDRTRTTSVNRREVIYPKLDISLSIFAFDSVKVFIKSGTKRTEIFNRSIPVESYLSNRPLDINFTYQLSKNALSGFGGVFTIEAEIGNVYPTIGSSTVSCQNGANTTSEIIKCILSEVGLIEGGAVRKDPLAQSFFIEKPTGVFATSLDLYFASKDSELPVTVQLRSMSLGTPTETVYPFSEVVLNPNQVQVSNDSSIATKVVFPSPVFLAGNQEHAIVLLSNSTEYKVWISRLGEVDVTTTGLPESQQNIVSKQPTLGSLFKSQNASTWSPSQLEDLKFNLYSALFVNNGTINFYNPDLSKGNQQIANLVNNPLEISSRKIRVGLGSTVIDSGLTVGNKIVQRNSNANAIYVGAAGSATGNLLISNPGIGYTPSSSTNVYSNVSLTNITGFGNSATANITISNGVAIAATINNGGTGYQVGDVVSISGLTTESVGRNMRLTIQSTAGNNQLILDNVQGEFKSGVGYTMQYINNSGVTTDLNGTGSNVLIINAPQVITDGLHIKVNHKNHGMHSDLNSVVISGVSPDIKEATLFASTNGSSDIVISDTSSGNFETFENVAVSVANTGYAIINNEIIGYTGVSVGSPGRLLGITRSVDQTKSFEYSSGTRIQKYEFNGVSLRRINKQHDLVDIDDSIISDPIGLDHYYIKLNPALNGVDRTVDTTYPKLYLKETKNGGLDQIYATQNIQFEALTPVVQTMSVPGTDITANVRTVSGTSISGSEVSFLDKGTQSIDLNATNYFNSPRIICSKVNETSKLSDLPNNKSFTLTLNLSTSNPYLSPVIDLDRVSVITTTNRVNSTITNYVSDGRVATLEDDPSEFVYATEIISLENAASSIKVLVSAHINVYSDMRAFYAIVNDPSENPVYYPFPGYNNRLLSGDVIDLSSSDGTSDKFVSKTDRIGFDSSNIEFKEHEFTIDNLPSFKYFSVKLVGTSTNQSYPPRYRDLRVIALA